MYFKVTCELNYSGCELNCICAENVQTIKKRKDIRYVHDIKKKSWQEIQ